MNKQDPHSWANVGNKFSWEINETIRAWLSRIIISLVPVAFSIITVYLGNSLLHSVGEGFTTFAYFLVLLGSENVVLSAREREKGISEPIMWEVMLVILAMVFWMTLVFLRIQAESPLTGPPSSFFLVGGLTLVLSAPVLFAHSKSYRQRIIDDQKLKEEMDQEDRRQANQVEGDPKGIKLPEGPVSFE